jgi:hypothetical protein
MARNNEDDVAYCGKSLQTLNEVSGDQLYRYYYRFVNKACFISNEGMRHCESWGASRQGPVKDAKVEDVSSLPIIESKQPAIYN